MELTFPSVLAILGTLGAACWVFVHLGGAYSLKRIGALPMGRRVDPLPALSVVVAACNEADTIGPAIRTLLGQDYPGIEIVVVDDRSTDGTGEVVDGLAESDHRVRVMHVAELPAGWLGKTNALRVGAGEAKGEYILFADADVHYRPGALAAALSYTALEAVDHLTLLPKLGHDSLLHEAMMNSFATGYASRSVLSSRPFGYGAFNLVRRSALERSEGFGWFRMEVVDDMALGLVIARAGGRGRFLIAPEALELTWYPSAAAVIRGVEKNAFGAMARYSIAWTAAIVVAMVFGFVAPFLPLLAPAGPWIWGIPAVALGALAAHAIAARQRLGHSLASGLLTPVANLSMGWALVRSAFRCLRQGGIVWRGTLYPLESLKKGRKIAFP